MEGRCFDLPYSAKTQKGCNKRVFSLAAYYDVRQGIRAYVFIGEIT